MAEAMYPFDLEVDAPQPQGRLSVFFRLIFGIPHFIVLYFLSIALSVITFIAWFAILFTGKYPAGLHRFALQVTHWSTRVSGYLYLLTDKYPPFALGDDAAYPVRLIGVGETEGRNRLTVFFRILMIIPHLIVLALLGIAAEVVLFIAWLVGWITGNVPQGLATFLAGVLRWQTRVNAYTYLLTDVYPPFSMGGGEPAAAGSFASA
jgi:hypothetical protein